MQTGRLVAGTADEQNGGWVNAVCPWCQCTTTYDQDHRKLVSNCKHLVARLAGGGFLFSPAAEGRRA